MFLRYLHFFRERADQRLQQRTNPTSRLQMGINATEFFYYSDYEERALVIPSVRVAEISFNQTIEVSKATKKESKRKECDLFGFSVSGPTDKHRQGNSGWQREHEKRVWRRVCGLHIPPCGLGKVMVPGHLQFWQRPSPRFHRLQEVDAKNICRHVRYYFIDVDAVDLGTGTNLTFRVHR